MIDWSQVELDYRLGMDVKHMSKKHALPVADIEIYAEEHGFAEETHNYWGEGVHPRYVALVDEYLVDWDIKAAAKRCGMGRLNNPHALLKRPKVGELLRQRMKDREQRTHITQDAVLAMLYLVATVDVRKMYNPDGTLKKITELDDATAFALSAVDIDETLIDGEKRKKPTVRTRTTKVKFLDRLAALRDIGKHIGMYNEKVELTGRAGGAIETKDVSMEDIAKRLAFVFRSGAKEAAKIKVLQDR